MCARLLTTGMLLLALLPSTTSAQHIATPAAIEHAVSAPATADAANRAIVLQALERQDVREMAHRFGVDLKDAQSAVAGLSGAELAQLAAPAQSLANEAGGQTTVVISLTTLLLVLLIVAIIAS
jgi:ABC-type sugar transport system ATPase subunit